MAYTYNGDPSRSPLDAVRFLIGDTDASNVMLQDGEIQYVLNKFNQAPHNAAIECVESIIAKLSRVPDEKVGQVDIKFSQRMKMYSDMLIFLRQRMAVEGAVPFAGGISKSQKQTNLQNNDLVRPDFTKHMMENHQNSNVVPQTEGIDDGNQED